MKQTVSVIIPAKNEAINLEQLLPKLVALDNVDEILVINDGSTDGTAEVVKNHSVKLISHPYSKGNGAAVKTGARAAQGNILVFLDGDGQHNPADIPRLLDKLNNGYDMVVGARSSGSQANIGRSIANRFYNRLASYMAHQRISDLTSGFRAVDADKFRKFLYLLPNGFSYPTTITMTFFRAGYSVAYEPIVATKRRGKSHIHPIKDGIRFLLIIFKIGSLYSPLKLFTPISFAFFSTGSIYYLYTLLVNGRFTNMSALMLSTAVIIFLIGLVSEQITALLYKNHSN